MAPETNITVPLQLLQSEGFLEDCVAILPPAEDQHGIHPGDFVRFSPVQGQDSTIVDCLTPEGKLKPEFNANVASRDYKAKSRQKQQYNQKIPFEIKHVYFIINAETNAEGTMVLMKAVQLEHSTGGYFFRDTDHKQFVGLLNPAVLVGQRIDMNKLQEALHISIDTQFISRLLPSQK